jgi:hypothetical protein
MCRAERLKKSDRQSPWRNFTDDSNLHGKFAYKAVNLAERIRIAITL